MASARVRAHTHREKKQTKKRIRIACWIERRENEGRKTTKAATEREVRLVGRSVGAIQRSYRAQHTFDFAVLDGVAEGSAAPKHFHEQIFSRSMCDEILCRCDQIHSISRKLSLLNHLHRIRMLLIWFFVSIEKNNTYLNKPQIGFR